MSPPTGPLGNWYANLDYFGRVQFIMATRERSLLTVVLPEVNVRQSIDLNRSPDPKR